MHLDLENGQKSPPGSQDKRQRVATISRPDGRHVGHGSHRSVVREQYCACTSIRRTKLEKFMIVIIIIMGFIILALISAIGAITRVHNEECGFGGEGHYNMFQRVNVPVE